MQEADEEQIFRYLGKFFTEHVDMWNIAWSKGWEPVGAAEDVFDFDWSFERIYTVHNTRALYFNNNAWVKDSEGKIVLKSKTDAPERPI